MYFSLTISFFLQRNAEISGNFPGNLLVSERKSFRKLYSLARETPAYPNLQTDVVHAEVGDRGMEKPGAGVRGVCGAVGACLAGRIVANGKPTHSPREVTRGAAGWCAMQAGVRSRRAAGGGRKEVSIEPIYL